MNAKKVRVGYFAGICGIALAASYPVITFSGPPDRTVQSTDARSFDKLDANHDGYISPEEAHANAAVYQRYGQLDQRRDMKVDRGEFSQFEVEENTGGGP